MKKIFIYILLIITCFAGTTFAKCRMNEKNESVKLLKFLTQSGDIERKDDIPIEKADVTEDTARVKRLKYLYEKDFNDLDMQKNPDIMKHRGTIE